MALKSGVNSIKVDVGFCLFAVTLLFVMPLRFVLAWLLSVLVHELSHLLVLYICKVRIFGLCIHMTGVEIKTEPIARKKEILCALAGPFGSCCLALWGRYLPLTAICAFVQAAFNLLPIYPLDGGRALQSLLISVFGDELGSKVFQSVSYFVLGILFVAVFYLAWYCRFNILSLAFLVIICLKVFKRKSSCKQGKLIVQ